MGKVQWYLLALGFIAAGAIYFLFDIRPPESKEFDKVRSMNGSTTSEEVLIREGLEQLPPQAQSEIRALGLSVREAAGRSDSLDLYKSLSGSWFAADNAVVAGIYAERVAALEASANAWGIAGTTFALAAKKSDNGSKEQLYALDHARAAFESAISLDPDNIDHRVNLAVTYADFPPEDNPMQGIQSLLGLSRNYPDHPGVLYQLGRFGMQTGQHEKAIGRLEKVVEMEPNRVRAYCLLVEAYEAIGNTDKARIAREKCEQNL